MSCTYYSIPPFLPTGFKLLVLRSVMFHDPSLERTTGTKAIIKESVWNGEKGIHTARTIKQPSQAIPTFAETVNLLMKVSLRCLRNIGPLFPNRETVN